MEPKNTHEPAGGKKQEQDQGKLYQCPMKCEGEKVYDKPGDCPICSMHLILVDESNNHGEPHHDHDHEAHSEGVGKYYCPMHCEGDKTYDTPGNCPVCGMHLQKAETKKSPGMVYTCPMHPEIMQNSPGSCPKCGMDLVPEKGEDASEEEKAYKKMAKKFWIAFTLSIPVFVIAMSEFFSFLHLRTPPVESLPILLPIGLLLTPIFLW